MYLAQINFNFIHLILFFSWNCLKQKNSHDNAQSQNTKTIKKGHCKTIQENTQKAGK